MFVLDLDRTFLYKIASKVLNFRGVKNPVVGELGVFKGDNAVALHQAFSPKHLVLVDSWSKEPWISYDSINANRPWVAKAIELAFYYGGDPTAQSTHDVIFDEAMEKIAKLSNVDVVRRDSMSAFQELRKRKEIEQFQFDFLYVDASHQYEEVLDDLLSFETLVDPINGLMQLNDCCHSELGVKQNLGVLEAATKFCKLTDMTPILCVNRDFTDVMFCRRGSQMMSDIARGLDDNGIPYVEVPSDLFGNISIKRGLRPNISFGSN